MEFKDNKSGDLLTTQEIRRPTATPGSRVLLSTAYKKILAMPIPEDMQVAYANYGVNEETTWAELVAYNVVRRAMGRVADDQIDFRAITELRETTEGKTPDKVIAAGANIELVNLAQIMAGNAAPPDDYDELRAPAVIEQQLSRPNDSTSAPFESEDDSSTDD